MVNKSNQTNVRDEIRLARTLMVELVVVGHGDRENGSANFAEKTDTEEY